MPMYYARTNCLAFDSSNSDEMKVYNLLESLDRNKKSFLLIVLSCINEQELIAIADKYRSEWKPVQSEHTLFINWNNPTPTDNYYINLFNSLGTKSAKFVTEILKTYYGQFFNYDPLHLRTASSIKKSGKAPSKKAVSNESVSHESAAPVSKPEPKTETTPEPKVETKSETKEASPRDLEYEEALKGLEEINDLVAEMEQSQKSDNSETGYDTSDPKSKLLSIGSKK